MPTSDRQIERLFVAALVANPSEHEKLEVGHTDLVDHDARSAYAAFANVREAGVAVTPDAIRLQLQADYELRADPRPGEEHADLRWFDELLAIAVPADPPIAGWALAILRFAARRAQAAQLADEALEAEHEIDDFALRDAEPRGPEPPPPASVVLYKPSSELVVDVGRKDLPPIRSYSTGFPQLDNLLGGGINTRELAVVLGPPGGCKTAMAISLAVYLQRSVPILYASTELEQHELMARVAANVLRKPWGGIRRGTLSLERITQALEGLNIWLLGCDLLPMEGDEALQLIEREAKWIADEQKQPPVIFIDYLQDLARGAADRDVRSRVGDHARTARAMSQRLDGAVVAISSVARTYYSPRKAQELKQADDPTVYLAAAKESGDVDYAAARVLFLDADEDRDKEERAVRIAVAKSRDARTGFAGARVISECGVFLPAPDVLEQMAQSGRAVEATAGFSDEADEAMLKRLVREHVDGKRELCTKRYLRVGNSLGKKPLGKERAEAALDRLVQTCRARLVTIQRIEGDKPKAREIYEPIGRKP